jgi:hypothetical protein
LKKIPPDYPTAWEEEVFIRKILDVDVLYTRSLFIIELREFDSCTQRWS